jgi:hypothetical protein
MGKVLKENAKFEAARSTDAVAVGRQRITTELEQALSEFHDIHAKLSEGSSFYSDLVGRLMQISQTVEGYIYAQSLTRRDVDLSYSSQSNKASVEASDAALARRLAEELQMGDDFGQGSTSPTAASATPASSSYDFPPPPTMASSAPPPFPSFGSSSSAAAASSPPPPAYGAVVGSSSSGSTSANTAAAARLADMGFPMAKVQAALKAHNNDEEKALDQLLSS